jgi:hypothetical protein
MATTNTSTTINTPVEIRTPFPMRVKDHGLTVVHDITGKERKWIHEVSVRDTDTQAINYLADAGYSESHGWRKDGTIPFLHHSNLIFLILFSVSAKLLRQDFDFSLEKRLRLQRAPSRPGLSPRGCARKRAVWHRGRP